MHSFKEVTQIFDDFLANEALFPGEPAGLYDPCRYMLQLGGKRVRPALCLMAAEMFGTIHEDAKWAALAYELFHNFTLIHDDIMDAAPLRRGNTTVHEKYGLPSGILSGDAMSIYAYKCLQSISAKWLPQILHIFNKTAIEVCEGQQLDMDYEKKDDIIVGNYLKMIELKTSVLLAASLYSGALIADAGTGNCNLVYEFGKNLGIAFQLQDDYLDAFGDGSKTGKQKGGDIRANKKTILWVLAYENADGAGRKELLEMKNITPDERVDVVFNFYQKNDIQLIANSYINKYTDLAFDVLSQIKVEDSRKEPLRKLTQQLLVREH